MNLKQYGQSYENFDLENYNTFKLKVKCRYFIKVKSIIKLQELISYLEKNKCKYFIIGGGSNIILPQYYNGTVIKLESKKIIINQNKVIVDAGYYLNKLALEVINYNLSGLEWASGIPGTIGGSIVSNAGAYGSQIMDILEWIEVIDNNSSKILTLTKNDFNFDYRYTNLKEKNLTILKACFILKSGEKSTSQKMIQENTNKRILSQPLEYPSVGSIFRNPENGYAGQIIEKAGLKGYTYGGAKISEKHANFIINYNHATSKDIIKLINYIHKTIKKRYNIDLIIEPKFIN